MIRPPPRSTRTDTLFPYTTLFRSRAIQSRAQMSDLAVGGAITLFHNPSVVGKGVAFVGPCHSSSKGDRRIRACEPHLHSLRINTDIDDRVSLNDGDLCGYLAGF